jgi:DNA-binding NarL/FixJ family response regulator
MASIEQNRKPSAIVIDDSRFVIDTLTKFLKEKMSFEIVACSQDSREALKLYQRYRPDLMFLDLVMPNKTGYEVLVEILAECPEAKIMIVTAVRGGDVLECLKAGACGYIEKPLKFGVPGFAEGFMETIREALG